MKEHDLYGTDFAISTLHTWENNFSAEVYSRGAVGLADWFSWSERCNFQKWFGLYVETNDTEANYLINILLSCSPFTSTGLSRQFFLLFVLCVFNDKLSAKQCLMGSGSFLHTNSKQNPPQTLRSKKRESWLTPHVKGKSKSLWIKNDPAWLWWLIYTEYNDSFHINFLKSFSVAITFAPPSDTS